MTARRSRIWEVSVTSFVGSIGATHTYGVLEEPGHYQTITGKNYWVDGRKWTVERILTEETAGELNRLNERFGRDGYAVSWKAGDPCPQFNTRAEVEEAARAIWVEVDEADDTILLSVSGFGGVGPEQPLGGPREIVDALRKIWEYDESEKSNNWTEIRQTASNQWQEALDRYDLDEGDGPSGGITYGEADAPKAGASGSAAVDLSTGEVYLDVYRDY